MPVIAKAEKLYLSTPEDLISRHQFHGYHQNPSSLPPTVLLNGNTLDRSIFIFRAHHRACAERRKHGLSYELRVEAFKTGKYLEKLDCPTTAKHSHPVLNTTKEHTQSDQETTCGTKPDLMDTQLLKQPPLSPPASTHQQLQELQDYLTDSKKPRVNHSSTLSSNTQATMIFSMNGNQPSERQQLPLASVCEVESSVSIKTEPESGENTPQRCAQSPAENLPTKPTSLFLGGKSAGPPKTKRRRYSIPTSISSAGPRSSSYSDDAGDDLSLSAEDCISGVISTPPIKPLEEGDNVLTTPSPTTNAPLPGSKRNDTRPAQSKNRITPSPPIENAVLSQQMPKMQTTPDNLPKNSESSFTPKGDSLFQDLDDFTRVMEMVTKEQLAKERQASFDLSTPQPLANGRHSPPQHMTPPYYPPASQISNSGPPQATRHVPISQSKYSMQQQQQQHFKYPLTPVPRRAAAQDVAMENRHPSRPHSLLDMQARKQPQSINLSGVSPQMESPQLMSPTILPTPQTSIQAPGYPIPTTHCTGSVPDHPHMNLQPPRTPTTPLEHFSAFPLPPAQQVTRSPTQTHPFFPSSSSSASSYPYPPHRLSSSSGVPNTIAPTWPQTQRTHSHLNSPQGSLNESLVARVNSNLEVITGQKRPPPMKDQRWSVGGRSNETPLTMLPFSSQFSGASATHDSQATGLAPAPYHNHSALSRTFNHHHPL